MRRLSFALALTLGSALPVMGQPLGSSQMISAPGPETTCVLHAPDADDVYHGVNELRQSAAKHAGGGATFNVTYTGFTPQAETAFQFAVDIWAAHLESDVPINVEASFSPLGTNVLGSARAAFVRGNFTNAPVFNTWYGDPLADALAGADLGSGGTDIVAQFSSNFSGWYFGTDGNTPANRVDFVSVVLHELGHGLGFFGSGNVDNGTGPAECDGTSGVGCYGLGNFPVIFDRFIEDQPGNSLLNTTLYPNPSTTLGTLLRNQNLFLDAPASFAVYGDERPPIWAPAQWEAGSSYSHWDETVIPAGDVNALMTPQIAFGESFQDPGPLTCALFRDIGWELGPACAALVVDDEDGPVATTGLALEAAGPNPFRSATAFRVRIGEPQALRATLLDALGREVAVLHDGAASGAVTLRIAGDLAPGVYTVVAETGEDRALASVVRVR